MVADDIEVTLENPAASQTEDDYDYDDDNWNDQFQFELQILQAGGAREGDDYVVIDGYTRTFRILTPKALELFNFFDDMDPKNIEDVEILQINGSMISEIAPKALEGFSKLIDFSTNRCHYLKSLPFEQLQGSQVADTLQIIFLYDLPKFSENLTIIGFANLREVSLAKGNPNPESPIVNVICNDCPKLKAVFISIFPNLKMVQIKNVHDNCMLNTCCTEQLENVSCSDNVIQNIDRRRYSEVFTPELDISDSSNLDLDDEIDADATTIEDTTNITPENEVMATTAQLSLPATQITTSTTKLPAYRQTSLAELASRRKNRQALTATAATSASITIPIVTTIIPDNAQPQLLLPAAQITTSTTKLPAYRQTSLAELARRRQNRQQQNSKWHLG